jgi:deazaflavin-dependent oxidoreductase (nitroreductase family)
MIGVKPLFSGSSLNDQDTAKFEVAMVTPDGKQMAATGLKWQLLSVESKYQWYRSKGYWSYEPIKVTRRVADGTLDVAADKPGKISVPVTWGRYRLEIGSADPAGPETTIGFDSGWYAESSADTPDLLEIALDKPEYKPGEAMTVAVTARSAGKVTLSVIGDKLISQTTTDVQPGLVKLPLTVGADWGTGAYVLATLRRPLDTAEKRMPSRAIGVQWFSIDKAAHTIGVALDLPALIRPETTLRIPVKLAGLEPNEAARIVVSAVERMEAAMQLAVPLKADAHVELQDGPTTRDYLAREVTGDEKAAWWARAVETWPAYATYQTKTSRQIPVFVLEPGRSVGVEQPA